MCSVTTHGIYFTQNGILNFEQLDNLVLKNTLGIAFPLLYGIEGAAEFVYDINTGAVEGTEKVDQTYRLRLGIPGGHRRTRDNSPRLRGCRARPQSRARLRTAAARLSSSGSVSSSDRQASVMLWP
jgi:hypothetical protein